MKRHSPLTRKIELATSLSLLIAFLFLAPVILSAKTDPGSVELKKGEQAYSDQQYSQALKWFLKAAAQGNQGAQNKIAFLYAKGLGVRKDYQEALKWYHKTADIGNGEGQFYIGVLYEYGNGMPQDFQEALKWFRKSAAQKYPSAFGRLGDFYEKGFSVPRDYAEALKWYQKGADEGNDFARQEAEKLKSKMGK